MGLRRRAGRRGNPRAGPLHGNDRVEGGCFGDARVARRQAAVGAVLRAGRRLVVLAGRRGCALPGCVVHLPRPHRRGHQRGRQSHRRRRSRTRSGRRRAGRLAADRSWPWSAWPTSGGTVPARSWRSAAAAAWPPLTSCASPRRGPQTRSPSTSSWPRSCRRRTPRWCAGCCAARRRRAAGRRVERASPTRDDLRRPGDGGRGPGPGFGAQPGGGRAPAHPSCGAWRAGARCTARPQSGGGRISQTTSCVAACERGLDTWRW